MNSLSASLVLRRLHFLLCCFLYHLLIANSVLMLDQTLAAEATAWLMVHVLQLLGSVVTIVHLVLLGDQLEGVLLVYVLEHSLVVPEFLVVLIILEDDFVSIFQEGLFEL